MSTETIVIIMCASLMFATVCFLLGAEIGKASKEKRQCAYSCSACKYWPCPYLLCEIEQMKEERQEKETPRHQAGD